MVNDLGGNCRAHESGNGRAAAIKVNKDRTIPISDIFIGWRFSRTPSIKAETTPGVAAKSRLQGGAYAARAIRRSGREERAAAISFTSIKEKWPGLAERPRWQTIFGIHVYGVLAWLMGLSSLNLQSW